MLFSALFLRGNGHATAYLFWQARNALVAMCSGSPGGTIKSMMDRLEKSTCEDHFVQGEFISAATVSVATLPAFLAEILAQARGLYPFRIVNRAGKIAAKQHNNHPFGWEDFQFSLALPGFSVLPQDPKMLYARLNPCLLVCLPA